MTHSFLSALGWRNATKEFLSGKIVTAENLEKILESIRLAPSSFGLQPYHVYVVRNPETLQKIQEVAWNQPQVTSCSHLLVFCSRNDTGSVRIDEYLETASAGDAEVRQKLQTYEGMMRGAFSNKSVDQQKIWADRQAYIALGFAMAACAELRIDSCPMEGFDPNKVDEVLNLPAHMKSVVMLPIGYRKEEPRHDKVRFSKEDLFTFVA